MLDYCVNKCPYYHDVAACMGGEVCPLKKAKRERTKKIIGAFSMALAACGSRALLFHLPQVMFFMPLCFLCSLYDMRKDPEFNTLKGV